MNMLTISTVCCVLWLVASNMFSYPLFSWSYDIGGLTQNIGSDWICSPNILTGLTTIIKTLRWSNAIIFYETMDDDMLVNITRHFNDNHSGFKTTIYNVAEFDSSTVAIALKKLYLKQNAGVRIILLLRDFTFKVLKMADMIDRYSSKTTNYETASWWIILAPATLEEQFVDFNLQNIITLTCDDEHLVHSSSISKGHITLIDCFNHGGASIDCFNHGGASIKSPQLSKCSVNSLFPNIKYRYNKRHLVIGTVTSRLLQTNVGERNQTVYTGLTEELTRLLAQHLNFTYTFQQPVVGQYGDKSNGGDWNGLVGQLHRQEVDIVIADLVITEERERVIDFILPPFLASSWAALYKKGIDGDVKWIKIFRPFQTYIYLIILFTVVPVAMLFYVLTVYSNDLSRDERLRDHLQLQDLALRLVNIIISMLGMLFIRGDGMSTKKIPVRILLVSFWIVPVVLAGIYVGNLTASLTDSKVKKPFNNLEELVGLTDWKWGIRGLGLYKKVMQESKNTMIKRLWNGLVEFNKTDPSTFDLDINVHINKILKPGEQYVYIGADSKYQLLNRRDCNLNIIDHLYSYLPMAIAVSKDSYLKSDLELALGKLSDSGFLKVLKDKFDEDNRPSHCKMIKQKRPLRLSDVVGAFVVASIGLAVGVIVLVIEIFRRRISGPQTMR